jgi:CheY-like chemotaxis protein
MATVLVAEDDPDVRAAICRVVQRAGHAVMAVADGEQALARVREEPPDLVLTDGAMPKMTGFELCRRLYADPATAAIPVLMISGSIEPDQIRRELPGLRGALRKPFSPSRLIQCVSETLAGQTSLPTR